MNTQELARATFKTLHDAGWITGENTGETMRWKMTKKGADKLAGAFLLGEIFGVQSSDQSEVETIRIMAFNLPRPASLKMSRLATILARLKMTADGAKLEVGENGTITGTINERCRALLDDFGRDITELGIKESPRLIQGVFIFATNCKFGFSKNDFFP